MPWIFIAAGVVGALIALYLIGSRLRARTRQRTQDEIAWRREREEALNRITARSGR